MDPIGALSIATSIITFVDFGNKLVSAFSDICRSNDGLPSQCSALVAEAQELSSHVAAAKQTASSLRERYPKRANEFKRLDEDCTLAGQELHTLVASLKACPGQDLRSRASQAITAAQGVRKRDDIKALEERFGRIRQQTQLSVTMCIWENVEALGSQRKATDRTPDDMKCQVIPTRQGQPQIPGSCRINVLWESTTAALDFAGPVAYVPRGSDSSSHQDPSALSTVRRRILESLIFDDMVARKSQIQAPFPKTFRWLLESNPPANCGASQLQHNPQTDFTKWLTGTNDAPFWITGKPASGKSTLMKFICTDPRVKEGLSVWSGRLRLVVCDIYMWNAGFSRQKDQLGLLRTILYQILLQDPELCHHAAPKHYLYFQLPVGTIPDPPDWTVDQLREAIIRLASAVRSSHRFAIFIDGLDEYEGNLQELVEFLKSVCEGPAIKLCVSSRPWNVFKDAFDTYPSLKMELLTKADIEEYVQKRMAGSRAFQELRCIDASSVNDLESQIAEKAEGVFLWVVLVVESLLVTARDDNNLQTIRKAFQALPRGLGELYSSMRSRLDLARLGQASKMYQILFQWKAATEGDRMPAIDFWAAANHEDPTKPANYPAKATSASIKLLLERQVGGCTGGILQIVLSGDEYFVDFLHRTAYDWLKEQWTTVINDGPPDYDPALAIASALASRQGSKDSNAIDTIFQFGRFCHESLASKTVMIRIVEGLEHDDVIRNLSSWANKVTFAAISKLSDQEARVLLAIAQACVPYLEAKMESGLLEHICGLPRRRLLGVPISFKRWRQGHRQIVLFHAVEKLPRVVYRGAAHRVTRTLQLLLQVPSIPRKKILATIEVGLNNWTDVYKGGRELVLEILQGLSVTAQSALVHK